MESKQATFCCEPGCTKLVDPSWSEYRCSEHAKAMLLAQSLMAQAQIKGGMS